METTNLKKFMPHLFCQIAVVQEAKRRGLDCGVRDNNKTVIASKPETRAVTQPKPSIYICNLCFDAINAVMQIC